MKFTFYKYQGTGNDFVIIDNRHLHFPKQDTALVAKICDRRFGVGADGLLLLENNPTADFTMVYYNSDGNISTMCGNGGRCIVHFAQFLEIITENVIFEALDGMHKGKVIGDWVSLKMNNVESIKISENYSFLNTGSPHHVEMVNNLKDYDVFTHGRSIRHNLYGKDGANINFVEQLAADTFSVRTYERGVEAETLSCGTGVTAVAIAMFERGKTSERKVTLHSPGGKLQVRFNKSASVYNDVFLEGPATQVFKGIWP